MYLAAGSQWPSQILSVSRLHCAGLDGGPGLRFASQAIGTAGLGLLKILLLSLYLLHPYI